MIPSALYNPLRDAADAARVRLRRGRVAAILGRTDGPTFYDDPATSRALLAGASPRLGYGYDEPSLRRRAAARASKLLTLVGDKPRALEVGCGDGMAGLALADAGSTVTLLDLDDWRHDAAKGLPFHKADACAALPVEAGSFDLAYSYNTFEHLPDPAAALAELLRAVRPGGVVHLKFGPLFASAWGMHAYKTLPIPYAQFLFSPGRIDALLRDAGIYDLGRDRDALQPMNRWRLARFDALFAGCGAEVIDSGRRLDARQLGAVLNYPDAFAGRGLTVDDLIVKTLRVTLRKPLAK